MTGPTPAVAATRVAVRAALADLAGHAGPAGPAGFGREKTGTAGSPAPERPLALVACSGGADSLALAAATAFEAPRAGWRAGAVVVDHGLQADSAAVAARAAQTCRALGLDPVDVAAVEVVADGTGPEAAARTARYRVLAARADELGARAVLLGHTRDDQAEQVLLGLARGSGARSLAGMAARRGRLARPLLGVGRDTTAAACRDQGLTPWADPHNDDERYARVRARRLVAALDAELGPGLAAALARSAQLLRADDEALSDAARALADGLAPRGPWDPAALTAPPAAVRGRLLRLLCARAGTGALSHVHVEALVALARDGAHGPVALPGGWHARRSAGRIHLRPPGRVE